MAAPASVSVARLACVCEEAALLGPHGVSVGAQSAVAPRAALQAAAGRVSVGRRSVVEDGALLAAPDAAGLSLGDDCLVESGAEVRASRVGRGCRVEPKARLGAGCEVGDHCVVGSGVEIAPGERLPDRSVVVCVDGRRVVRRQQDFMERAHAAAMLKYIDCLTNPKSAYALERNHRLLPANQPE